VSDGGEGKGVTQASDMEGVFLSHPPWDAHPQVQLQQTQEEWTNLGAESPD
jgi:hypothetical protein